jgi:hypothetical protein
MPTAPRAPAVNPSWRGWSRMRSSSDAPNMLSRERCRQEHDAHRSGIVAEIAKDRPVEHLQPPAIRGSGRTPPGDQRHARAGPIQAAPSRIASPMQKNANHRRRKSGRNWYHPASSLAPAPGLIGDSRKRCAAECGSRHLHHVPSTPRRRRGAVALSHAPEDERSAAGRGRGGATENSQPATGSRTSAEDIADTRRGSTRVTEDRRGVDRG